MILMYTYFLERFIQAQNYHYQNAVEELKKGKKETHWMWFIFPQLKGLGRSYNSQYYGLDGYDETYQYYNNDILRSRIIEICHILLENNKDKKIEDVMDEIDAVKLKSSMTLFYYVTRNVLFKEVLDVFFEGNQDVRTLSLINF